MNWMEITATVFGLICVFLTIRQNIWCWPTGLIQVLLYIVVFYQAKLYSDSGLQIIYVIVSIYGWYQWLYGNKDKSALPVTSTGTIFLLIWVIVGILGSLAWGYIMKTNTDAAAPYADAFIVVLSLIAQWLMTRKKLESWYFWITVDVLAVGVYLYKHLYFTTGLYAVFLILAIWGLLAWKKPTSILKAHAA